jgi:hypothetical protein
MLHDIETIDAMTQPFLLLATRSVWGRFDHERPSFDSTHWWLLLGCVVLFAGFAAAIYRSSRQGKCEFEADSQVKLFRDLCRAHRLSSRNRRLLRRLASARGVAEPARLFIEPKHFEVAQLPETLRASAEQIRRLRNRLFG